MTNLHVDALVAEIGSTTTVVSCFDGLNIKPRFAGQGMAPTTAHLNDVTIGLSAAIEDLKNKLNVAELTWDTLYAASSAAGGLKMTVHGLVYEMTARAAEMAALGAGAVVRQVTAGKMNEYDLKALKALSPNLILLAGGTDYGDRETAIYNAEQIAGLKLNIPALFAGNIQAADTVKALFESQGQAITVIENVYPKLDQLNIEPARRAIQDLFETHIVKAPGMANIRQMVKGAILPTPGAVMEALRLLQPVFGDVVAVDIGGATTDVHSGAQGSEEIARIQQSPEPFFKRTVEGDLGTYINAGLLAAKIGLSRLSNEMGMDAEVELAGWPPIPQTETQQVLAARLAKEAGEIALHRHAGKLRSVFLPEGQRKFAEGKDLSEAKALLVTGGALTKLKHRLPVLKHLRDLNRLGAMLYPKPGVMQVYTDKNYLLAALGVLSRGHREAALKLLEDALVKEDLS